MQIQPPLKSQAKSLLSYIPDSIRWYRQAWEWRQKYGAPRSEKCNGSKCWVLLWEPVNEEENDDHYDGVDHVDFKMIKALAPRLECFVYERECGCTNRWWGRKVWIRANCARHGLRNRRPRRFVDEDRDY